MMFLSINFLMKCCVECFNIDKREASSFFSPSLLSLLSLSILSTQTIFFLRKFQVPTYSWSFLKRMSNYNRFLLLYLLYLVFFFQHENGKLYLFYIYIIYIYIYVDTIVKEQVPTVQSVRICLSSIHVWRDIVVCR